MKIAIGVDHGGFSLKQTIVDELKKRGYSVVDCGALEYNAQDDYPDFARAVGAAIQRGDAERGILICGSGVGASIAATKMRGIRAGLCHDTYSAHQGVEHDNMNVLCLGARIIGDELARELVRAFLAAQFNPSERFQRRLNKVLEIERDGNVKRNRSGTRSVPNPLIQLKLLGQSVWLDNIRRGHILSGGLKKLIEEDGISGETSNPAIFEKAIAGNAADYADAMRALIASGASALAIYDALSIADVQMACDVFRPVYDAAQGADGYVSIEVSPHLAHDTAGTVADARRLFKTVNRPNVMIKIPGTLEGVPAIEECLYSGVNVNVTLLFAVSAHEAVMWAYVRALERRAAEGKPIDRIASVASFFVSRIDTLADKLLADKAKAANAPALKTKLESLQGKAAIANAKIAYAAFKTVFGDARFAALRAKGARVQRPLWASTSTKNPKYPDTLYVDALIGRDTVNTLPPETIDAFRDHGKPRLTIEEDLAGARQVLQDLEGVGVSMNAVTRQVLDEGIVKFEQAFDQLLASIEEKKNGNPQ
jgi:transaldolase